MIPSNSVYNENALIAVSTPDILTMSSREIAEVVQSRHDSVKRAIERLSDNNIIVQPPLVDEQITDEMGRPRTVGVYRLDKRSSIIVVAQLSPEFTAKLVDRWQELEYQLSTPRIPDFANPAIAARAYADQYEARMIAESAAKQLEAKVQEMEPCVMFHEAVTASSGSLTMQEAAKTLGVGPTKLFSFLRRLGILMKDNVPYQRHIEHGHFEVETYTYKTVDGLDHINRRTYVTGKGLSYIQKRIGTTGQLILVS